MLNNQILNKGLEDEKDTLIANENDNNVVSKLEYVMSTAIINEVGDYEITDKNEEFYVCSEKSDLERHIIHWKCPCDYGLIGYDNQNVGICNSSDSICLKCWAEPMEG